MQKWIVSQISEAFIVTLTQYTITIEFLVLTLNVKFSIKCSETFFYDEFWNIYPNDIWKNFASLEIYGKKKLMLYIFC